MSKIRKGNKQNAGINGEWGKHVRRGEKRITSGRRRAIIKKDNDAHLKDKQQDDDDMN